LAQSVVTSTGVVGTSTGRAADHRFATRDRLAFLHRGKPLLFRGRPCLTPTESARAEIAVAQHAECGLTVTL
jgi:hypothetical protein